MKHGNPYKNMKKKTERCKMMRNNQSDEEKGGF